MKIVVAALAVLCSILFQGPDLCSAAQRIEISQRGINTTGPGPQNIAVVAPQTPNVALLCCVTGATMNSSRIQWWEYGTRRSGNLISDSNVLLPAHPNYARYQLRATGLCYELTIFPINLSDGTKYECFDLYADPPATSHLGLQLIVLKENPLSSTSVGQNDAVEHEYYSLSCSLEFAATHPIAPLITWTGPPSFTVEEVLTNSSVWSGLGFIADRSMNARAFSCKVNFTSKGLGGPNMVTNIPSWTYNVNFEPLRVKWAPANMTFTPLGPDYEIGELLTCNVDANPVANYSWLALEGPVAGRQWFTQSIELTLDMGGANTLLCHAQNVINGLTRTLDNTTEVFVNFINACSSRPCKNGATCVRDGNGYYCLCRDGFTGRDCESQITFCTSEPCLNGGTCYTMVDGYECICYPDFTGLRCETPLPELRNRRKNIK